MKLKSYIFQLTLAAAGLGMLGACEDMLEPTSEYVMYDRNHLTGPADTANSLVGIIYKLQAIGDRTNLLGEVRGDLVSVKSLADADLKALANFEVTDENKYNDPRDYYAVINNCNYFIQYADTLAEDSRGNLIFEKELAQVKAIRAWTYLQLVLNYGKVPFYTNALLTNQDADAIPLDVDSRLGIEGICDFFINDLKDCTETDWPQLHTVGSIFMPNCFFPVNVVLGDLYLWKATYSGNHEDYRNAARCYFRWIFDERNLGDGNNKTPYVAWPCAAEWSRYSSAQMGDIFMDDDNYSQIFSQSSDGVTRQYFVDGAYSRANTTMNNEIFTIIPMDSASTQGYYSEVRGLYNSNIEGSLETTEDISITPSDRMLQISQAQHYCYAEANEDGEEEQYEVQVEDDEQIKAGDLRLSTVWYTGTVNVTSGGMADQVSLQLITKLNQRNIAVYRQSDVWLRLAEALNNGGFPRFAYAILATGLSADVVNDSVLAYCTKSDSAFISELNTVENRFSQYYSRSGTSDLSSLPSNCNLSIGIHSRGCGYAEVDSLYAYPMVDSVDVNGNRINGYTGQSRAEWAQMNLTAEQLAVDSMIINEMALETCFEGKRFYDLIRWAERYHNTEWVAGSVSKRNAEANTLYGTLQNKNNWFLKWKGQIGME